jgi:hypothetical protein
MDKVAGFFSKIKKMMAGSGAQPMGHAQLLAKSKAARGVADYKAPSVGSRKAGFYPTGKELKRQSLRQENPGMAIPSENALSGWKRR